MTYWVRILLITNVAMFFMVNIVQVIPMYYVWFRPAVIILTPWTIFTYMWTHGGFFHILMNMFVLYQFGSIVEGRIGSARFIGLYVFSGLVAAVLHWMLADPNIPIVGASGSVAGVILAFARYWPETQLALLGVIPMRARTMVAVFVFASIVLAEAPVGGRIAHFAHLGGVLGGYLWVRGLEYFSGAERFKRRVYQHVKPSVKRDQDLVDRARRVNRDAMHEINRSEFDRLLAKIDAEGIRSLTLDERAFLDRVS